MSGQSPASAVSRGTVSKGTRTKAASASAASKGTASKVTRMKAASASGASRGTASKGHTDEPETTEREHSRKADKAHDE